jgi:nucleoside-diphosphate-sugar epimerase
VFSQIARGDELVLPNFGMETVHHVHADDVAQIVMGAIANRSAAVGEAFNAVSPQAINLKGYAAAMYRWFGREPRLAFEGYETWKLRQSADDAAATWEHIFRSPSHSVGKAERLLGHRSRYSSLEAVYEAVGWLVAQGQIGA